MDDVVAVEIELEDGRRCWYLTWGRIQHPVDAEPLEAVVLACARGQLWRHGPVRARLAPRLAEAAREPYFYECLFDMARRPMPDPAGREAWVRDTDRRMREGRDLWFLGIDDAAPGQPPATPTP